MMATSFDLRDAIVRHPWRAIAIALAAGAGIAFAERSRSAFVRAAGAAAGGAVFAVIREVAAREVASHARSWLDEHQRPHARA